MLENQSEWLPEQLSERLPERLSERLLSAEDL